MPKHRGPSRSRPRNTIVKGAGIITTVISTGNTPLTYLVNPAAFPRSFTIATEFQLYRFTRFHIYMVPVNIAASNSDQQWWAIGYSDSSTLTDSMTSPRQVLECIPSGIQSNANSTALYGQTFPSGNFAIPKSDLMNQGLKWWRCAYDTNDNYFDTYQFQLVYYNQWSTSQTFQIYVKYTIEFKSPINALLSMRVFPPPSQPKSVQLLRDSDDESLVTHPSGRVRAEVKKPKK